MKVLLYLPFKLSVLKSRSLLLNRATLNSFMNWLKVEARVQCYLKSTNLPFASL